MDLSHSEVAFCGVHELSSMSVYYKSIECEISNIRTNSGYAVRI